jgi:hypothetical protein
MDHRVALVALTALNLAAAAPLSLAWIRILPEEPPPFEISPPDPPNDADVSRPGVGVHLATFFLVSLVTVGYVVRFPGFPLSPPMCRLHSVLSDSGVGWVAFAVYTFFVVALGLTACHAMLRTDRMRIPLGSAAVLVLVLWLLTPTLRLALLFG